jgi:hypothetical protein
MQYELGFTEAAPFSLKGHMTSFDHSFLDVLKEWSCFHKGKDLLNYPSLITVSDSCSAYLGTDGH